MKKFSVLFLSLVLLLSTLSISNLKVQAQSLNQNPNDGKSVYSAIGMSENSLNDELDQLINLLEEMDSKGIDIINLENNKSEQIELLSPDAKELYLKYELEIQNNGTNEVVGNVLYSENSSVNPGEIGTLTKKTKVRGIYISNATVKKLNTITNYSGGIFGVAAALIKMKLGLSPTALTMLILAVGTLGMKVVNSCNKYKKGFYLSGEFYGIITMPQGVVTCVPRK
ncbi:hypothetical protein MHB50_00155 [Siminovitchia sp. FSL H7-0308]|uniref:hypothetical protein n=1 Tax=Siminovitchia sp. FSL H7-0308 TaxID=2921432 RepID=UPI0030ED5D34